MLFAHLTITQIQNCSMTVWFKLISKEKKGDEIKVGLQIITSESVHRIHGKILA